MRRHRRASRSTSTRFSARNRLTVPEPDNRQTPSATIAESDFAAAFCRDTLRAA